MRATAAASAGNLSRCHDFLSFASGVSAWLARWVGGDDCLAGTAGSASSIRRQCNTFSLEIAMLKFYSAFFSLNCPVIGTKDRHVCFSNSQEQAVDHRPSNV
jgi:hypothetical protein